MSVDKEEVTEPTNSLEAMEQALDYPIDSQDSKPDTAEGADAVEGKDVENVPEEGAAAGETDDPLPGPDKVEGIQEVKEDEARKEPAEPTAESFEHLYKIPHGLKGEARKNYKQIADHAQALTASLKEATDARSQDLERYQYDSETLKGFRGVVEEARAKPEQMSIALELISHVNYGRYEEALAIINDQRNSIALLSGKVVPGLDLLSKYEDLKAEVDEGTISEDRANELAFARARGGVLDSGIKKQIEVTQDARIEQTSKQADVDERAAAIAETQKLLQDLKGKDINYAWKDPILTERMKTLPDRPGLLDGIHPSLWKQQIKLAYDLLTPPAKPQNVVAPLRARGGAGGSRVPQTSLEAMELGLKYEE